jgi:hypothetical protein
MNWFRKSPFGSDEDAAAHMVELVAAQAEKLGTPLSVEERGLLLEEAVPPKIASEESEARFRTLIEQTFDSEVDPDDPMNLGNSIQWAGAERYPKIVALAEEVVLSRGEKFPQLRGRRLMIDRMQLVGCGIVAVILMLLVVVLLSWLFGHR